MIGKAAAFLKQCDVMIVGAGAGMGKDSGLPDFRGKDGFWNQYPPYRNKFDFYQCANPQFLLTNPHLFWGFYGSRLNMYRNTTPHQGYQLLKDIALRMKQHGSQCNNLFAVTSNVDGHFIKANYLQSQIFQVHGSLNHLQCDKCQQISNNTFQPDIDYQEMSCRNLPLCPKCNQAMRPNVLMFNDWEWIGQRSDVQEYGFNKFQKEHQNRKIAIIQIGCGSAVPTMRSKMETMYYRYKTSKFIRINPDPSESSAKWLDPQRYVDIHLGSLQAIKQLTDAF